MDNKLIMEDYLLVLKSTVEVFVHGTLESSNANSRNALKNGLDMIMNSQNATYNLMSKYGWYQVKNINSNMILDTINKLQNVN